MLCCSNLDDLEKWQRPLCRALYVSVTGNRNADTNSHSPNLTFSQRGQGYLMPLLVLLDTILTGTAGTYIPDLSASVS